MNLPPTFTRPQVIAAMDALGLTDDDIVSVHIIGTQIDVEIAARTDDGDTLEQHGELATITVTIPVDEQ